MSMQFVPIHPEAVDGTAHVWLPFVERIAKRAHDELDSYIAGIRSGEIQVHIVWDADAKRAVALAGTRLLKRTNGLVCEMIWLTGEGREHWQDMIEDLELYMIEHHGCTGMKAVCRPGWSRVLKARGYRMTHCVMERDF